MFPHWLFSSCDSQALKATWGSRECGCSTGAGLLVFESSAGTAAAAPLAFWGRCAASPGLPLQPVPDAVAGAQNTLLPMAGALPLFWTQGWMHEQLLPAAGFCKAPQAHAQLLQEQLLQPP